MYKESHPESVLLFLLTVGATLDLTSFPPGLVRQHQLALIAGHVMEVL